MKLPFRLSFTRVGLWAVLTGGLASTLAAVTSFTLTPEMTTEMGRETMATVFYFDHVHYLQKTLADFDQRKLLSAYMTDLDSRHLFLLDSDVTGFQDQFAPTLVHNMKDLGNIEPAYAIFEKFRDRVRERVDWIDKRLDGDFDLTAKDTYHPDRDDSPWPTTKDEADKLWEQQLRFELINELLATDTKEIDAANQKAKDDATAKTDVAPKTPDSALSITSPASSAAPDVTAHTDTPAPANDTAPKSAATATAPKPDAAPKTDAEKLAAAKDEVRKRYDKSLRTLDETEAVEVQEVFLNTLAMQYDPHSSFFSDYLQDDFNIQMNNSLIGIGAVLEDKDDYCTISELIVGGPAEKSGLLHVGDKIEAVAQADGDFVDVVGAKLRKTVSYIRGEEGTIVRLQVVPANDPAGKHTITLKREKIELTTTLAKAQIIELPTGNTTIPIGVIDIPAFYGGGSDAQSTTDNVRELITKLKAANVQGIVLDVRRNGGGFLDEAVNLTGLFIPPATVLQTRKFNGDTSALDSQDSKVLWNGPLIVLDSKLSASATEIMTGALQDYHRALVVGDQTTHGKGTVQSVIHFNAPLSLSEQGSAKITIEKWYLPDGNSIQSKGVTADIALPSDIDFLPIGESDLKNALPWDSIKPVPLVLKGDGPWRASLVNDQILNTLRQDSTARENSLAELKMLQERVAWEKAREDQKDYSLNFAERLQQRKDDIVFRDQLRARTEELAKNNYKSTDVLLDVAKEQAKNKTASTSSDINPLSSVDDIDEADTPIDFDIQLRESLRIMGDWIQVLATKQTTTPATTVAAAPAQTPAADAKPAN
jgi:carboxyl-terminal processing protease